MHQFTVYAFKGNAVIWIHHANYGRRDLVTCPHKLATSSDCYCPQTSSLRSRYRRKTPSTVTVDKQKLQLYIDNMQKNDRRNRDLAIIIQIINQLYFKNT